MILGKTETKNQPKPELNKTGVIKTRGENKIFHILNVISATRSGTSFPSSWRSSNKKQIWRKRTRTNQKLTLHFYEEKVLPSKLKADSSDKDVRYFDNGASNHRPGTELISPSSTIVLPVGLNSGTVVCRDNRKGIHPIRRQNRRTKTLDQHLLYPGLAKQYYKSRASNRVRV